MLRFVDSKNTGMIDYEEFILLLKADEKNRPDDDADDVQDISSHQLTEIEHKTTERAPKYRRKISQSECHITQTSIVGWSGGKQLNYNS